MDQEQKPAQPAHGQDQILKPEGDTNFNSLIEHYHRIAETQADASPFEAPTANTPATEAVICPECGSSVPAVSRLCRVCGTPRKETAEEGGLRIASAAPALMEKQTRFETYPTMPATALPMTPGPDPGDDSTARDLFQDYYPARAATENEVPPEKKADVRRFARPAVAAALLIVLAVLAWMLRRPAVRVFANVNQMARNISLFHAQGSEPATPQAAKAETPVVHSAHRASTAGAAAADREDPPVRETTKVRAVVLPVSVEGQPHANSSSRIEELPPPQAGPAIGVSSASSMRISITPRQSMALLLRQFHPVYPPLAAARGVQGSVVLKATIGRDGNVLGLEAVSGEQLLVPAAIEAVRLWQYRPYYLDGQPQEVETLIMVEFTLASLQARK